MIPPERLINKLEESLLTFSDEEFDERINQITKRRRDSEQKWLDEHKKSITDLYQKREILRDLIINELDAIHKVE